MLDRLQSIIGCKITFGNVGRMITTVDQHMVPGLIPGRARSGNRLVPLFGTLKCLIDIDDDATIVEQAMVYQIADREPGPGDVGYRTHCIMIR